MVESSKAVKPWREAVKWAALEAKTPGVVTFPAGAVRTGITFWMPRPRSHYRTGKHSHLLRDDAPIYVSKRPDIEKLIRSTFDAITDAAVWTDDAQVVHVNADMRYDDDCGAHINIVAMP